MKLSSLHLEHFRNYSRLDFVFPNEPIVVLSGENAQGKTNFLEAIYMLALTKSFRTSDRDYLKQLEQDYYRIEAKGESNSLQGAASDPLHLELCEVHQAGIQRVLKRNGVKTSAPKFIGHLKVVLFRPEDLHMLTGEPAQRRKYLNTILIQTTSGYMKQLQLYQKLLTQRNALLLQVKLNTMPSYALDLWDEQLAEAGAALVGSRLELVQFLQNQLREMGVPYEVDYQGAFDAKSDVFSNADSCPGRQSASNLTPFQKDLYEQLSAALQSARPRDIRATRTSVGPHRDDLKLKINNQPLELTASRGELRSALMALKQAEIAWIQHKTSDTPIILLDDVFSELDSSRKNDLFDLLPSDAQIIMTVAEGNPLPSSAKLKSASTVRKVHAGQIF